MGLGSVSAKNAVVVRGCASAVAGALVMCLLVPDGRACTNDAACTAGGVCEEGQCVTPPSAASDEAAKGPPASPSPAPPEIADEEKVPTEVQTEVPTEAPPEVPPEAPPETPPTVSPPEPLPPAAPEPVAQKPAHAPRPRPHHRRRAGFKEGFATAGFVLSAVSFGHEIQWNTVRGAPYSVKTRENVSPGFRVAYHAVEKATRHSGLYFMMTRGSGIVYDGAYRDDAVTHWHFTAGLSARYGGMPTKRVWVGAALDFGLDIQRNLWPGGEEEVFYGPQAMPQFCLDIHVVDTGGFKLAIPLALGVNAVLFSTRRSGASGIMVVNWDLSPMLFIGVAMGG